MSRTLNLAPVIAEAQSNPLIVELDRGATIQVFPINALTPERIDTIAGLIEEVQDPGTTDARRRTISLRIPSLVMTSEDYQTWLDHEPPMAAFMALMDALGDFYAQAGTPGEGDASDA